MAIFENINIEKGMYQTKGGLTEALEKLDPSENYVGTSLEGLDAFHRICRPRGSSGHGDSR